MRTVEPTSDYTCEHWKMFGNLFVSRYREYARSVVRPSGPSVGVVFVFVLVFTRAAPCRWRSERRAEATTRFSTPYVTPMYPESASAIDGAGCSIVALVSARQETCNNCSSSEPSSLDR